MQEVKNNRTKLVTLRLTPAEYELLNSRFKATTCCKLSDYLRKVLLTGKVTVLTRNKSLDDFMAEMIELRNQLSAIGNNFNQAVRRLHLLCTISEFQSWLITNELQKEILLNMIEQIKNRINQFAEKW
jgi:hypothetical protein